MADNYTDILLEDINGKFGYLIDVIKVINEKIEPVPVMQKDLSGIKSDVKTIKVAVTETNKQLQDHEVRITSLEAKI